MDRAGEARRGWMSERLKESVLKTEVFIEIPGVRIPLHPRGHKFSLALSIDKNKSDHSTDMIDGMGVCVLFS